MAWVRSWDSGVKWNILGPIPYVSCIVDLTRVETTSAGGIIAATAAVLAPMVPAGTAIAAVLAAHAEEIFNHRGAYGCSVSVRVYLSPIPINAGPDLSYAAIGNDGSLLKASGPEVYYMEAGRRRWVTSPAVFQAHNFSWDAVSYVSDGELSDIPRGADLN